MMSSLSMQKCASLNQFILNLDLPFSRKGVFGFASYKSLGETLNELTKSDNIL